MPCLRYDATKPEDLNAFLVANGGNAARIDPNGKAHILTKLRGEDRFVYCLPGSWLRCLGTGQFSAISDKVFHELYELI